MVWSHDGWLGSSDAFVFSCLPSPVYILTHFRSLYSSRLAISSQVAFLPTIYPLLPLPSWLHHHHHHRLRFQARVHKTPSPTNMQLTMKCWRTFRGTATLKYFYLSSHFKTNSRFILNLPDDELSSLERICFQVEQAYVMFLFFLLQLLTIDIATGSMKISFVKKTLNFHHCHSRNSRQCYSTHVRCCISGVTIMSKRSILSCSIKREYLYVVRSCWMIPGKRWIFSDHIFWNSGSLLHYPIHEVYFSQRMEIIFGLGFSEGKNQWGWATS